ncbi:MAG: hypothetical protein ACT4P7_12275 [Gemmatimonadaceae bacterium]
MTQISSTGLLARRTMRLLAVAIVSGSVACSGIFDVEDPQAFGDEDLNSPAILKNVADGAEGLLHQSFDDYIVVTDLLGDVMESTSTWIDWEDISEGRVRGDWPSAGSFSGPQNGLLQARFAAQSAADRISRVLGTAAAQSPLIAQSRFVDGMADLLIGQGWCEGPLENGGVRSPNTAFFTQAITKLTGALAATSGLAAADQTRWASAIRAARARANLLAGQFDAALADADAVPTGFVKLAVYAEGAGVQQSTTGNQFHQNRNRSGGLRRMHHAKVLGVSPTGTAIQTVYLPDWFDASKVDPRMALSRRNGELGVNNRFAYYGVVKYADRAGDITLLSKREMNLIAAEVFMRKNDYANMTARLNIDRTANGLAPLPTLTAANAQAALLGERLAVLFVEGQRMYDLHRFNLVTSTLGAGRATMLPLSTTEVLNNTSMKVGGATCPKIS